MKTKEVYALQDFIIKNIEFYVKEKKSEKNQFLPNTRTHFNPEAYYLDIHLKYLKRVKNCLGLNSELIKIFYAKIYIGKQKYHSSISIYTNLRYQMNLKYGKETCSITGNTTMHYPIHYHRIFPEIERIKTSQALSLILPISDNAVFLLEDTKEMITKLTRILINTYLRNYKQKPFVICYENVLTYFSSKVYLRNFCLSTRQPANFYLKV